MALLSYRTGGKGVRVAQRTMGSMLMFRHIHIYLIKGHAAEPSGPGKWKDWICHRLLLLGRIRSDGLERKVQPWPDASSLTVLRPSPPSPPFRTQARPQTVRDCAWPLRTWA
eukprot:385719-Amphidinium_carterae.1